MHSDITVTPGELPELLLNVAVVRPVFIWGQPGIGKSTSVETFANTLGLPCVNLLGTQLAPEDLIGVPTIITGADGISKSRFAPPENIARDEPYLLFLDELNGSSAEVQKAFYSLVLERRLGNYTLPEGSIIIAAGNRSHDGAIVKTMSTALINRFTHIHLRTSVKEWMTWAGENNIHPLITSYLEQRPNQLVSNPPKIEEPFSTPRSWHALSDILHSYNTIPNIDTLRILAFGNLTKEHAESFIGYTKLHTSAYDLDAIIKGKKEWPLEEENRELLHFLVTTFRNRLIKELPQTPEPNHPLVIRSKALLAKLTEVVPEYAQMALAADNDGHHRIPTWYLTEIIRDLPGLTRTS